MKKLCMIFDTPSLYREAIHQKIDEEYDCDWFLGILIIRLKLIILKNIRPVRYCML